MPPERNIISPEVQVMVEATKASTEQLATVNQYLAQISKDAAFIKDYLSSKDGLQSDFEAQKNAMEELLKQRIEWLWLKIAAGVAIPTGAIVALAELMRSAPGP